MTVGTHRTASAQADIPATDETLPVRADLVENPHA